MVQWIKSALVACLVLATRLAPAEDVDLFMGLEAGDESFPNVLILVDNTANWNTAFEAEMGALRATIAGLADGKVRIGFMLYTETGGGNGSPDGAYVRAAVRTMDATTKPLYRALVQGLDKLGDKSNNGKLGLAMSEVNRYFSGGQAYAGHNKVKRDYRGNSIRGLDASNAVYALAGNALSSQADETYERPTDVGGCRKNFVIFLSNGKSHSNTDDNRDATGHLETARGNTTAVPILPSGYQDEVADEWARYLAGKEDNPVITYVIDVVPTEGGQYSDDYRALLQSLATQGRGRYFDVGSADAPDVGAKIQAAFEEIFGEIAAVNTAFSAASLPVSVNTQGVYLNQVFIGMFRPDPHALPRWNGNLKQYQMAAADDGTLSLADRTGARAINTQTGFISPCALSYWTPGAVDAYWAFDTGRFPNPCATVVGAAASNFPDGDAIEKGAAGYRLRATAPRDRVVKTCTGACDRLSAFGTANADITAAALGVAAGERDALIDWIRGQDLDDEDLDANTTEMRPSTHGDVIHSRPLAVDYGGTTGVVVFYGGNDGLLHAVEGGKAGADGDELWSFVAPEHFGKLRRLRRNEPAIDFPAPPPGEGNPKDYLMDGSAGGFRWDASTLEPKPVWIYPTMRRGGRRVYALDVSNPASPVLMWRRGCPGDDDTGCDDGFTGIGQTWSAPQIFLASGYVDGGSPRPLAIFGGGYDRCEDAEPNTCAAPKGNRIFVVDAQSGALLRTLNTIRSVPSDITVVDANGDGEADVAYAADTGGNLYRIGIGDAAPAAWTITQVAALGCDTPPCAASGTYNRKFLSAPEVVVTRYFNAVLVGSGDREHPLDPPEGKDVDNAFFMVKDSPLDAAWLTGEADRCNGASLICKASLLGIGPEDPTPTTAQLDAKKGWYLTFGTNEDGVVHDDEQVVTSALVVGGVAYFSTHTPTASTQQLCGPNLGTARAYAVNFLTSASPIGGTLRFAELVGGGLAPPPVGGLVEIDGNLYPFIIGGRQLSGGVSASLEAQNAGLVVSGARSRTHWYIEPPGGD